MKKLLKIFTLLLLGVLPIIVNAKEKEVKYKWYKEVEENISYKSEVEDVCEYFDKTDFITSDWNYTLISPEKFEYRTIEEIETTINLRKEKIKYFLIYDHPVKPLINVYELEILDKNDNPVDFKLTHEESNEEYNTENIFDKDLNTSSLITTYARFWIELDKIRDVRDIKFRYYHDKNESFDSISVFAYLFDDYISHTFGGFAENFTTDCTGEICKTDITIKEEFIEAKDMIIPVNAYRYKDNMYKCFTKNIVYADGYHLDLSTEGYTKDESDFIVVEKTDDETKEDKDSEDIKVDTENTNNQTENIEEPPSSNNNIENSCTKDYENYYNYPVNNLETLGVEEPPITDKITNEINTQKNIVKEPIAMVTKEIKEDNVPTYLIFLTVFCLISIILGIILITKKLINSRMK